jgi:cytochrome P450
MKPTRYPPGPTWKTETSRSWKEQLEDAQRGLLVLVRKRFDRFGDIVYFNIRGVPTYAFRHPDQFNEILVTKPSAFYKRTKELGEFLGDGILMSNGETWRKNRRRNNPAFARPKLETYCKIMVEHTQSIVESWRPGETRDISHDMMALALSIVSKALLDYDTRAGGDTNVVAQAMIYLQNTIGGFDPFPRWVPTPMHRKQKAAIRSLDAIIYRMIDECTTNKGHDLVSLLKFTEDADGKMTRTQLRDELLTMFLAGHETTAATMAWCFFALSGHPEIEARFHEELDRVLGGRLPSLEDLDQLDLTKRIVNEVLRVFPPFYLISRVAVEDTEIGGYQIAKGSDLFLWVYHAHHDARWFPDPDIFDPDRFLPDSNRMLHPHAYLPFGLGTRMCIGRHFALAEAGLMLATVGQRFRLRLPPGERVEVGPRLTLGSKRPIMMRIEERPRTAREVVPARVETGT